MWAWTKALEAESVPAQTLDELTNSFYDGSGRDGDPGEPEAASPGRAARAAERLRRQPGWESRGDMMLGIDPRRQPRSRTRRRRGVPPLARSRPECGREHPRPGQTPQADSPGLSSGWAAPPRPGPHVAIDPGPAVATRRPPGCSAASTSSRGRSPGPGGTGPRRVISRRQPPGRRAQPLRGRGPLPAVPRGDLPGFTRQPAYPDLLPRGAGSGRSPARTGPWPIPPTPRSRTRSRRSTAPFGRRHASATRCSDR